MCLRTAAEAFGAFGPWFAHLALPLQLCSEPLEVTVTSSHARLLQLEDGQVGLRKQTHTRSENMLTSARRSIEYAGTTFDLYINQKMYARLVPCPKSRKINWTSNTIAISVNSKRSALQFLCGPLGLRYLQSQESFVPFAVISHFLSSVALMKYSSERKENSIHFRNPFA